MKLTDKEIQEIEKTIEKDMKLDFENIGKEGYIMISEEGIKMRNIKSCKHKEYSSLSVMSNAYILNLLANYKNLSKKEKEMIIKDIEILNSIVRGII